MSERTLPGTIIEANGLKHFVVDQGSGPAVVLIHGFPDSAEMWRHQVRALVDAGFRVIAPDLRGLGDSERPDGVDNYLIFNAVNDVKSIMGALGIDHAHVVGHDYGAGIAWLLGIVEPALVDKLVVMSVGHPGAVSRALFDQMQLSWYSFFFQFEGTAETALQKDEWNLMRQWLASSLDRDRCLEGLQRPGALTAGLSWYRANMRPELWGSEIPFPEVTVPTMGVWSDRDAFLTEAQMTDSVQFCSGEWRYEPIDGAGHWFMLDKPEEVNALLLDFLKN